MTRKRFDPGRASAWLAIGSAVSLPLAVILGLAIPDLGMVSVLQGITLPLAIGAVILGALSRAAADSTDLSRSRARVGLVLGLVMIGVVVAVIFVLAVLFSLLLWAQ